MKSGGGVKRSGGYKGPKNGLWPTGKKKPTIGGPKDPWPFPCDPWPWL